MILFPAIDIRQGKVVRLRQGKFDNVTEYGLDPVETALQWQSDGASWLHVVDLDGAQTGSVKNMDVILKIAKTVAIPVQMGGGVRSESEVDALLEGGVQRVVLGTKAVSDKDFLKRVLQKWNKAIAVSVDCMDGFVTQNGWTASIPVRSADFVIDIVKAGVSLIIFTDINRDGMMKGPNIKALKAVLEASHVPVIASGGVSKLEDVQALKCLEDLGLAGAIVGKALYEGKLDLKEALAIC